MIPIHPDFKAEQEYIEKVENMMNKNELIRIRNMIKDVKNTYLFDSKRFMIAFFANFSF